MSVSAVSICNQALTWLGQAPIVSFEDKTTTAEWMKINYPPIRDAVLEEMTWSFARERAESTTAQVDEWGGMYRHGIPSGWLLVQRVFYDVSSSDPSNWLPDEGWVREGKWILSNYTTVYLQGVRCVENPSEYTLMFVQALAGRIAADAAIPLTQNRLLQRDMWALYQDKIEHAASRDGQQGKSERIRARHLERRR